MRKSLILFSTVLLSLALPVTASAHRLNIRDAKRAILAEIEATGGG